LGVFLYQPDKIGDNFGAGLYGGVALIGIGYSQVTLLQSVERGDVSIYPTLQFIEEEALDEISIRSVRGLIGLYFISIVGTPIPYPFRASRLIYIGMSESRYNSIGNRLRDHMSGQSGNPGLTNYIRERGARFSHLTFDFLTVLEIPSVAELEGVFLRAFLASYGSYPISNNQSGIEIRSKDFPVEFEISWQRFD